MNKERILNNLKILGINSKSQLEKNEIDFWWEKKYIEIQRSGENNKVISELLIQLNEAKEYLDEIDEMKLKESLEDIPKNTNKPFGKQNKRIEKVSQKQKTSNFFDWDNKIIKKEIFYKNSQNNKSDVDIDHKLYRRFWFFIASLTSAFIFVLFVTRENKPVNIGNSYNQEKKVGNYKNKTIYYTSGDKYVGQVKDDKRHGYGTYTWSDGAKYVGDYINDERHGQGTMTWSDGSGRKYVGDWINGKRHGQGTMTWSNGDKYVGQMEDDKMNGYGTYTWSHGDKYVGQVKDEKMHGYGTYTHSSGAKYVGDWINDKRHGQGTYTWSNGRQYVGQWKDGRRQ